MGPKKWSKQAAFILFKQAKNQYICEELQLTGWKRNPMFSCSISKKKKKKKKSKQSWARGSELEK